MRAIVLVAILLCLPLPCAHGQGSNPPRPVSNRTSLRDQQRVHGARFPSTSGLHDRSNLRLPSVPTVNFVILKSQPAGDRTVERTYENKPGLLPQQRRTAQGTVMGASGWDGWYGANAPQFPATPAQNNYLALASYLGSGMAIERGFSPEQRMAAGVAGFQSRLSGAGNAAANAASEGISQFMPILDSSIINVANNQSGSRPGDGPFRQRSAALYMVQQMYRVFYLPAALLFALPGAILTQFKAARSLGLDADGAAGPWAGILRAIVGMILIGCVPLFVSYAIDAGNSLSFSIIENTQTERIVNWFESQCEQDPAQAQSAPGASVAPELDPAPHMAQLLTMSMNLLNMILCDWLLVLAAFQTVLVCYLFLLGPLASCFFIWPSEVGTLFRPVFSNWVSALVHVVLWRFWWSILTLCMTLRIDWLIEMGVYDPASQWEAFMLTAYLLMMTYLPFFPFDFRVGDLVESLLAKCGIRRE